MRTCCTHVVLLGWLTMFTLRRPTPAPPTHLQLQGLSCILNFLFFFLSTTTFFFLVFTPADLSFAFSLFSRNFSWRSLPFSWRSLAFTFCILSAYFFLSRSCLACFFFLSASIFFWNDLFIRSFCCSSLLPLFSLCFLCRFSPRSFCARSLSDFSKHFFFIFSTDFFTALSSSLPLIFA